MQRGRLHWFEPEELNDAQRKLYDEVVHGARSNGSHPGRLHDDEGRLYGAFNARLLDPEVGDAIQAIGTAVAGSSQLSAREREIIILEVARAEHTIFEWREGLAPDELKAIRSGTEAVSFNEREMLIRHTAQILLERRDLTDAEFNEAEDGLGLPTLFDLISVVGHYQHTAMSLRVWRVPLHDGTPPIFDPDA